MLRIVNPAIIIVIILVFVFTGCQSGSAKNAASLEYSEPYISGDRDDDWQKTNMFYAGLLIWHQVPAPTYLPPGYKIREVYYRYLSWNIPKSFTIFLLISDQEILWTGNNFKSRLLLNIGYNHMGAGLKMPWAEYIPEIRGRLEERDNNYALWWEKRLGLFEGHSTLILCSSLQFPREELIKIAASTKY